MRVLALDTTTPVAAAALVEDDRVLAERIGDPSRSHAERLPADLLAVLRDAGVELGSIDAFAVAAGPGSFTGLRIGIATVQGLAFVQQRPVVPVSVLEALAHAGSLALPVGTVVAAWMDAHRGEVFAALYRLGNGRAFAPERIIEIAPPTVAAPASVLARWAEQFGAPAAFIGDGAVLYSQIAGTRGAIVAPPPLAGTIGRIAVARARAGDVVTAAGVQPLYVRRPDAELARKV